MEKILLVEDSKSFAAILVGAIEQHWPLQVQVAFNLEQAHTLLQQQGNLFALAIIDLNLPDAPDGAAVDEVLAYNIPGIVFTAQLNDTLRTRILEKGVADYVLKQGAYNIDYVVNMVGRLLKNREICTLVVSANQDKRNQIGRWLAVQNLQVLEAGKALDALALLQQETRIQVVIIDYGLADMSSYSFIAQVREQRGADELVIIGISDVGERSSAVHFIKSGANDVLVYPFLPEELHCRVNRSLDQIEHFHKLIDLNQQKSRLMGMAAHDIRGPVGNVVSSCKMLRSDTLKPERRDQLFGMIEQGSSDVLRLLNDLLDVSAIESGRLNLDLQPLDLQGLLVQRVQCYTTLAEQKEIRVELKDAALPTIVGDAARLSQVIDNLLSNAIKYSPRGSLVRVQMERGQQNLRVKVIDQGVGIPHHEADKLFKAFSVVSSRPTEGESSTGLGLAICKNIVCQHGGDIGLEPSPGKGCTFYFTLPLKLSAATV